MKEFKQDNSQNRQVIAEIEKLEKSISELSKAIDSLHERLSFWVLSPEVPSEGQNVKDKDDEYLVPLADSIRQQRLKIFYNVTTVKTILNLLEL